MSSYDDIIHLSRPHYDDLPPMPIHDRAAQFSPFAALVGYEDAVAETVRTTEPRRERSEEEMNDLNNSLGLIKMRLSGRPQVSILYFVPDARKDGGTYVTFEGRVRTIDEVGGMVVFENGTRIAIGDMYKIDFVD